MKQSELDNIITIIDCEIEKLKSSLESLDADDWLDSFSSIDQSSEWKAQIDILEHIIDVLSSDESIKIVR